MPNTDTERMDRQIDIRQPRCGAIIQDKNIDLVTTFTQAAAEAKHGCGYPASMRIERGQNLQNFQCQIT